MLGDLVLIITNHSPEAPKPKPKLTQRRSGRQRLSRNLNCTFNGVERIGICDCGASDHVEVAIDQDDSRGIKNTVSWHEVVSVKFGSALPRSYKLMDTTRGFGPIA